jgi:glycine betaine/proline transport system permease protein
MFEFPESWAVGTDVAAAINSAADWVIINGDAFFDAIKVPVLLLLKALENLLLWLPWWLIIAATGLLAWKVVGRRISVLSVVLLLVMALLGLHDLAMMTLSLTLTATLISVGVGLPVGILAARSDRFEGILRPILDTMQTMPSFVYLIPVLMLLGLGRVPAVFATVVYAIPPMIRLTNLGIRQVDSEVIEAAKSFGSTSMQMLLKVELPMAMPSIMAGVNQTIMMALAMVVIASMVAAPGLGIEVFNGIAGLDIGRGFLGGLGIVILAVVIDRISQGFAQSKRTHTT